VRKLLICYAAGCLGALANSLVVWAFGKYGITAFFHVHMAPGLSPDWLYPRIVWGGIWGFLFLLPLLESKPFTKGALLSVFPTLVQLLVVFPVKAHKGYLGLELGMLTPLFVVFYNWVWGVGSSLTIRGSK
jgi:hypothetical protein